MLFSFGKSLKTLALPGLLVLVFGRSDSSSMPFWPGGPEIEGAEVWAMLLLIPAAFVAVVRYLTFRLRYEGHELVIKHGILFRSERHVPYARIQNLDAIRNVFHQLFGVVEVRVETGAGKEPEATISVLPVAAFDEMRRRVFEGRGHGAAHEASEPQSGVPAGRTILTLPVRELVLFGFIDNRGFVLIGAIIGALWQFNLMDSLFGALYSWLGWRPSAESLRDGIQISFNQVTAAAGGVVFILAIARIISMAWAVIRFHGFTLRRVGDDLRTEYGLLTRVAATIPIRRVQTLTIRQGPLERLAGRQSLTVETAGSKGTDEHRQSERPWLAPIIRPDAVPGLVHELVPELDMESLHLQPVHPRGTRRAIVRAAVTASLFSLIFVPPLGRWALVVWLLLTVTSAIAARNGVLRLRWAMNDDVVVFRSGWLWTKLTIARTAKVQAVRLVESPFDRRSAMATLRVDTAGAGAQSHRVRIPYLDRTVALGLYARVAAQAGATAFRW